MLSLWRKIKQSKELKKWAHQSLLGKWSGKVSVKNRHVSRKLLIILKNESIKVFWLSSSEMYLNCLFRFNELRFCGPLLESLSGTRCQPDPLPFPLPSSLEKPQPHLVQLSAYSVPEHEWLSVAGEKCIPLRTGPTLHLSRKPHVGPQHLQDSAPFP